MNAKNLVKQCEMVIKLSNGATNNELDFVYNAAKQMVDDGNGKSKILVVRSTPADAKLEDVCMFLRNLRVWHFCVVGDMSEHYRWQQTAHICDIVMIGNEYAIKYKS